MRLSDDGTAAPVALFRATGKPTSELVFVAAPPPKDPRFSPLAWRWLRFDGSRKALLLEPVPQDRLVNPAPPFATKTEAVVATWKQGQLRFAGRRWGDVALR